MQLWQDDGIPKQVYPLTNRWKLHVHEAKHNEEIPDHQWYFSGTRPNDKPVVDQAVFSPHLAQHHDALGFLQVCPRSTNIKDKSQLLYFNGMDKSMSNMRRTTFKIPMDFYDSQLVTPRHQNSKRNLWDAETNHHPN